MSATDDELTGLHNRRNLFLTLRRQITYVNEKKSSLALLVADIDGLAAMNNAYGFEFGDKVLQHVALQLQQVARAHDFVARIGDDRFAIILPGIMNKGHAELAAQKLLRLLHLPFESNKARVKVGVTIGVALCPSHATHGDTLLRMAEQALVSAREAGEHLLFAPDANQNADRTEFWDLEIELAGAQQRGELAMHYQPKVDCATLKPIGAEALMRWNSRSRGLVPADLFIPVAERTGQIKALTLWAMNTALRQAGKWKHAFGKLSVAVNVPADLVVAHDLPELVQNALNLWHSDRVQLALEITERSLVVAPEVSFKVLSHIRDMGVKVSIDDFGTGYSCLAYFKNIPADELKIDKSFVTGLLEDPASAEITQLIIYMAHRFGMSVVAEGVENEPTLRALQERQCDVVQGYLVGKPMSNEAFQMWLDAAGGVRPEVPKDMFPPDLRLDI